MPVYESYVIPWLGNVWRYGKEWGVYQGAVLLDRYPGCKRKIRFVGWTLRSRMQMPAAIHDALKYR
jgi:hypothetical protein